MAVWVATKDRLPDENSHRLEFTDGKFRYEGYFRNGQFVAELPTMDSGEIPIDHPQGVTHWKVINEV